MFISSLQDPSLGYIETMKHAYYSAFTTICGMVTTLAIATIPAGAYGPIYRHGICTLNTGRETESARCTTVEGGGTGVFFIGVVIYETGDVHNDPELGTYYHRADRVETKTFEWGNGIVENVRGTRFSNNGNWSIWVERGWELSFEVNN